MAVRPFGSVRDLRFGASVAVVGRRQTIPGSSIEEIAVRRSVDMPLAGSSSSVDAFADADGGFEYFATAEHCQHLAKSIVDALRQHCLVLVTGDPSASSPMLAAALREAVAPRAVIELSCSPDLICQKLFGDGSTGQDQRAAAVVEAEPGRPVASAPIFVLADTDRLSDDQIAELGATVQAMPHEPHRFGSGVLLAHPDFVARVERAELHLFDQGLAAHIRVQHLEREEVEAFIRHQVSLGERANLLTAQRVALIALASGGDPAVVNRLARRMLEIEPENSASPRLRPRRHGFALRLLTGIIICLGLAWLAAVAFEPQLLGILAGLTGDHTSPLRPPVETPAGVEPARAPTIGSSAVDLAIAPSNAAGAGEITAEPVAPKGPRFSAAEIAGLVARGDAFLGAGDIASARLFFERAANVGDGRAAMRMAVTYDAAFLDRVGLHGLRDADPERAAFWYRRARELGEGKAAPGFDGGGTSDSPPPLPTR
jgi:hypothetical protein